MRHRHSAAATIMPPVSRAPRVGAVGAMSVADTARADIKMSDTRNRIIVTAERLYRELGYQKTTVADIARELDMSPANVYRFFRSKDEINDAVGHRLLEEVISAVATISAEGGTAAERLRAALTALQRFHVERFTVEKKLHDLVAIAISDNWPMVHEYVQRMDTIFAGIIADGMASGEFRKSDPITAARCVHTAMIRYGHPRLMVECAGFPDPSLDQLIDFCLAALR
jgi:AcrR family transcriptional regulator